MKVLRTERKHDQDGNVVQVITYVQGDASDRVLVVRS